MNAVFASHRPVCGSYILQSGQSPVFQIQEICRLFGRMNDIAVGSEQFSTNHLQLIAQEQFLYNQ